jgi:hypothetical protein
MIEKIHNAPVFRMRSHQRGSPITGNACFALHMKNQGDGEDVNANCERLKAPDVTKKLVLELNVHDHYWVQGPAKDDASYDTENSTLVLDLSSITSTLSISDTSIVKQQDDIVDSDNEDDDSIVVTKRRRSKAAAKSHA